jgi:hypothetical protein
VWLALLETSVVVALLASHISRGLLKFNRGILFAAQCKTILWDIWNWWNLSKVLHQNLESIIQKPHQYDTASDQINSKVLHTCTVLLLILLLCDWRLESCSTHPSPALRKQQERYERSNVLARNGRPSPLPPPPASQASSATGAFRFYFHQQRSSLRS